MGHKLSHRQSKGWQTDTRRHGHIDRRRPKLTSGKNRAQHILYASVDWVIIGTLGTNFSIPAKLTLDISTSPIESRVTWHLFFGEISMKILWFPFKKMHLKILSAKHWPFRSGLNVLEWLSKVSANQGRCYMCNVYSHWLRPQSLSYRSMD